MNKVEGRKKGRREELLGHSSLWEIHDKSKMLQMSHPKIQSPTTGM